MAFELVDIQPALPEIILSAVALVLVLVTAFGGDGAANARRVAHLTLLGIVLAALALLSMTSTQSTAFGGMFRGDAFTDYMKLLVIMGSSAAVFMSVTPLELDDMNKPEFSLIVILALVGMMLMISVNDLMSLYMAV
jgi:NADH:ubiquinone oxidoreductase subunit 2 (chain N)